MAESSVGFARGGCTIIVVQLYTHRISEARIRHPVCSDPFAKRQHFSFHNFNIRMNVVCLFIFVNIQQPNK